MTYRQRGGGTFIPTLICIILSLFQGRKQVLNQATILIIIIFEKKKSVEP